MNIFVKYKYFLVTNHIVYNHVSRQVGTRSSLVPFDLDVANEYTWSWIGCHAIYRTYRSRSEAIKATSSVNGRYLLRMEL